MKGFERNERISRKRKMGLACAGAAGAAVAASTDAHADIISSGTVDQAINATTAPFTNPFYLDIDGDSSAEFEFIWNVSKSGPGWPSVAAQKAGASWGTLNILDQSKAVRRLSSGELFDSNSGPFDASLEGLDLGGEWLIGSPGYMGITLDVSGLQHFGWIEVTPISTSEVVLNRWAWEDQPGVGIQAGTSAAVPEPSSGILVGLLAVVGFSRFRRRRNAGA